MALPEAVGTGTIIAEFVVALTGAPDSGSVTFSPVGGRHVAVEGVTITVPDVVATLDGDGKIAIELISTDDPDHSPRCFSYQVEFDLASGRRQSARIIVPSGETSNLEDITMHRRHPRQENIYVVRGRPGLANFTIVDSPPAPEDMVAGQWYVVA